MIDILTVTLNPAVDISTAVDRIVDTHKLRCNAAQRDPGGGGINVARVCIAPLSASVSATILALPFAIKERAASICSAASHETVLAPG